MEAGVLIYNIMIAYVILIVVCGLGFIVGRVYWNQYKLKKNKELTKDKVLCEFVSTSGNLVSRELLEEYQGIIKRPEKMSRATQFLPIKPPDNTEFTEYHAYPEHDYLDVYPVNAPDKQQVVVKKYYFVENDPSARLPHDASKWDIERYRKVSSSISKDARNDANLRVLTSEMSGVWKSIENLIGLLKKLPTIMILSITGIGLTVIACFLIFMVYRGIGELSSFWLGS